MIYKKIEPIIKEDFLDSFLSLAISHNCDEYLQSIMLPIIESTNDEYTIRVLLQAYGYILRENNHINNKDKLINLIKNKKYIKDCGFVEDFIDDLNIFYKN